ncbi:glutaredoxin family protein [Pseudomonas stutzeri]|nr:glutaredoxin family protein [Stutzerimonas stutzeri]
MLPACQLFGTLGCHLCELAEEVLLPFAAAGVSIELVDIAEREEWVAAYGLRIPLLRRLDSGAELGWPFDGQKVAAFLGLAGAH